jgi:type II secretory ATPase GspE/PulE/Tfp pilus assembly ATPase PilB-like protein
VNISTVEDPIEYGLPGIMQTQINPHTNITYAEGLKSLMRQDPDILMIGEIRDFETGKIAVNAALTGHLVFSTVHTNNASLAPLRLLQMGVDPYLITTTVNLIIAQRLVRKICNNCLTSYMLSKKELDLMATNFALDEDQKELFKKHFGTGSAVRLFKGRGCEICANTGYHARSVIAETLQMKDNIRQLISRNATEAEIQKTAEANGMISMMEDGFIKVKEGITTLEEVFRVINQ